jgi:RNA polymerase sigma factor (sigma-70 family)
LGLFISNSKKSLSDLELVAGYKNTGDNDYMAEIYERYTHLVYGVCMKYFRDVDESKDAVMQIFEKLMTDLVKHEITQFKSWLHTVAKNHCLMHIRSRKALFEKNEELKKDLPIVMENYYGVHLDTENDSESKLKHLDEGLKDLNEEQRICVELFYLQEKCYQEVAEITGYTMNQVKSYIQNGKRNLKIYLTNKNGNESP